MKLTVLVDNNTLIDRYFYAEPAVSYFIEDQGKKVLFDVGYSDAFIANARKLAINLLEIDFVVLSHSHLDHTWGLVPLLQLYTEAVIEQLPASRPKLVSHPGTLLTRRDDGLEIGSLLSREKLSSCFDLNLSQEPVWLTESLVFLGSVERTHDFEASRPIGKVEENGVERDDYVAEDSALAYKSPDGLVIVTGCSHAGICNIVEHAKKLCGEDRVVDIVGGLHLLDPAAKKLRGTLDYLRTLRPGALHACHCTDLRSKIALAGVVDLQEVGVGLSLEY